MIKQKVLEFLNNKYDDEIEDEELLQHLIKYRNRLHPDNHIGVEEEFKDKYNEANELLTEYKKEIQSQTNQLVLAGEILQDRPIDTLLEVITLGEENRKLADLNASYKLEVNELKNRVQDLESKKIKKEVENEILKYKPKKKEYGIITSTIGITAFIALSSQINILSSSIKSIFPFNVIILQIALLIVFILCTVNMLCKSYISKQLKIFIDTISTRKFRNKFIIYLTIKKNDIFTDDDIVEYIENYIKENKLLRLYSFQNKFLNQRDLFIDACTDLVIDNLYENKAIKSYTTNRVIKTYSLNPIRYSFEWKNIDISDDLEL